MATPTAEQLEVLTVVASFGRATRGLVELYRREDSASLLKRMVRCGLLAKSALLAPNIYRITVKALGAPDFATVEAMRAGLPVADGQKATFSIAVIVSTVDVPCFCV